jgi:hypothetical protein
LYHTTEGKFELFRTIQARDVGWSVLDTAFSPDGNYIVYSSWSECRKFCKSSVKLASFAVLIIREKNEAGCDLIKQIGIMAYLKGAQSDSQLLGNNLLKISVFFLSLCR